LFDALSLWERVGVRAPFKNETPLGEGWGEGSLQERNGPGLRLSFAIFSPLATLEMETMAFLLAIGPGVNRSKAIIVEEDRPTCAG
jgi:hypothetical protein